MMFVTPPHCVGVHAAQQRRITLGENCSLSVGSNGTISGLDSCSDAVRKADNLVLARDVSLIGFGLTSIGTIVTGVLLGVHRGKEPARVSAQAQGVVVRF